MTGAPAHRPVVIVADDLTGSLDAAAPFASRGLRTEVAVAASAAPALLASGADVLSVNTASRHLESARAVATVAGLGREIAAALRPGLALKKIDSTLRGHVASETVALGRALGRERLVVCPAIPDQGRIVAGGEVYVDGVRLGESEYARDRRSPPPPAPLAETLTAALGWAPGGPGRVVVGGPAPAGEAWVWIADAASADDLAAPASAVLAHPERCLAVGSDGLAEALARAAFGPARAWRRRRERAGCVLCLVGSLAARTRAQVAALRATLPPGAVLCAPLGALDDGQLAERALTNPRLLVEVPPEPLGPDPDLVAARLGRAAAGAVERLCAVGRPPGAILVTGGDVALALVRALGVERLTLEGELEPGVPLSRVTYRGVELDLVTKAGGFGSTALMRDLPARLQGS